MYNAVDELVLQLRSRIVRQYRKTGELLLRLRHEGSPRMMADVLRSNDISESHALECINLFGRWEEYEAAERWCEVMGARLPVTAAGALNLVDNYRRSLN